MSVVESMRGEIVSSRGFHGSSAGHRPESTRLCDLVARQTEAVTGTWDLFRDCFEQRDLRGARPAFARFHDALRRVGRWEEQELLTEAVRRGLVERSQVAPHDRQHASLESLAAAIERSLAEYPLRAETHRTLARAVDKLEGALRAHDGSALHEVCCMLGRLVGEDELARMETAAGR